MTLSKEHSQHMCKVLRLKEDEILCVFNPDLGEFSARLIEANPKAASVRDPVTNLYPFMLAGMHGNTDAAFTLLLANPTLVIVGNQAKVDSRKRKRSLLEDID